MNLKTTCDVMVVDDDNVMLKLVERRLRNSGLTFKTQVCPNKALVWLRTHHVRLLLVDLRMPSVNGDEFLATLYAENKLKNTSCYICSSAMPESCLRDDINRLGASVILKEGILTRGGIERLLMESDDGTSITNFNM